MNLSDLDPHQVCVTVRGHFQPCIPVTRSGTTESSKFQSVLLLDSSLDSRRFRLIPLLFASFLTFLACVTSCGLGEKNPIYNLFHDISSSNLRLSYKQIMDFYTVDFWKRVVFGDLLLHLVCELLFSFCTRTITCGTKTGP